MVAMPSVSTMRGLHHRNDIASCERFTSRHSSRKLKAMIFGLAYDVAIAVTFRFCNIVLCFATYTDLAAKNSVVIRVTYWFCS